MTVSRGWRSHVLLCAVIVLSAASLRLLWQEHFARDLRETQKAARQTRSAEIEKEWQRHSYLNPLQDDFAEGFLARIKWSSFELSDLQALKMREPLKTLLDYFRNPNLEAYYP